MVTSTDELAEALRCEVRTGLSASPKWLPARWFYDARRSELFELITQLAEYYPTCAEPLVLDRRAADIARLTGTVKLLDLRSGSGRKTRLLLDALLP